MQRFPGWLMKIYLWTYILIATKCNSVPESKCETSDPLPYFLLKTNEAKKVGRESSLAWYQPVFTFRSVVSRFGSETVMCSMEEIQAKNWFELAKYWGFLLFAWGFFCKFCLSFLAFKSFFRNVKKSLGSFILIFKVARKI